MKVFILALFVLALLVAAPSAARADYEDGDRVPDAIVAPLMSWVERQVGVRVPALPRVITSHSKLIRAVRRMGPVAGRARALYAGGTVLLDHYSFLPEESTQLSLLVHELVHYAQSFQRNTNWACPRAKEFQAYTLQNKWLEQQGHAPYVSASWIRRMASCPTSPTMVAMAD